MATEIAYAQIIHVAGYAGDPHFQKVANIVAALEHLIGSKKMRARIIEHSTQEEYTKWAQEKVGQLNTRGVQIDTNASPLCYNDKDEYLGTADQAIEYFRSAFLSRSSGNSGSSMLAPVNPDLVMNDANGTKSSKDEEYEYDLIVIGGGSGGLACAKQASKLGAKVAMCDFVKPSPLGTKWGLGGTCVNVGCIPKKLMHTAALLRESMLDYDAYGWELGDEKSLPQVVNWPKMVQNVQNHIKSLNFKYRVELREKDVKYEKKLASFTDDPHTIEMKDKNGNISTATARRIVVAVGGRPTPINCEGGELAISSDDIFSMKTVPGKTLIIGASYIALECAGFLRGCGFDVTVMVRSILLRGFDRDCCERIGKDLVEKGVKFIYGCVPSSIKANGDEKVVTWINSGSKDCTEPAAPGSDTFNTVLGAIGRTADTTLLNVDKVGLKINPRNKKLICENEQTNIPHIYAIGDVIDGRPELTPVAIQAGKLLAKRIYEVGCTRQMDYHHVATTVFTPLEYGTIGFSEEDAEKKYGAKNIEVYHRVFAPLEWTMPNHRPENMCYAKLICDKNDNERVVGFHYCGPNAGEVTQGWSLAMKCGATYDDFWNTVGIHPTVAEEFTILSVTKASGESAEGGSC